MLASPRPGQSDLASLAVAHARGTPEHDHAWRSGLTLEPTSPPTPGSGRPPTWFLPPALCVFLSLHTCV